LAATPEICQHLSFQHPKGTCPLWQHY